MPGSLQPHGLQHTRLLLSFTISQRLLRFMSIESVMLSNHLIICRPLLLLLYVFPSVRVFSSELLFASGGQSSGASALVLPMITQGWFPLGLTALIALLLKGLRVSCSQNRDSGVGDTLKEMAVGGKGTCLIWKECVPKTDCAAETPLALIHKIGSSLHMYYENRRAPDQY